MPCTSSCAGITCSLRLRCAISFPTMDRPSALAAVRAAHATADPASRGWKRKLSKLSEEQDRDRSRAEKRGGCKAQLKAWASGETSAVGMWRAINAIVNTDKSDVGVGLERLANLASSRPGSAHNCHRALMRLLKKTELPGLIGSFTKEEKGEPIPKV